MATNTPIQCVDRCSNIATSSPCPKTANKICSNCHLVQYCSRECQTNHWTTHKIDCRSPMMRTTWRPDWSTDNRTPAFTTEKGTQVLGQSPFGPNKFLWGNMPAYDVLELEKNEGPDVDKDLAMLFAASGDLRNVVVSVSSLPDTFKRHCEVVINDRDEDIVARNVILLLTVLSLEAQDAVPMMIHIWYSAQMPESILQNLRKVVLPLVEDVCQKIRNKSPDTVLGKTWTWDSRSLRVVLTQEQWFKLLSYFNVPSGLSADRAQKIRQASTLAPQRVDYLHRALYPNPPPRRVCIMKFRKDGLLLPFGASREDFNVPNPTFFQDADTWPMKDAATPLDGWPVEDVLRHHGLASEDLYGCLYRYLYKLFTTFSRKMRTISIGFVLHQVNALHLPTLFRSGQLFDRIEVSNITDRGYLGPEQTLKSLGPLLKTRSENPHATLISLFLNACAEVHNPYDMSSMAAEIGRMRKYIQIHPSVARSRSTRDPDLLRASFGRDYVRDYDTLFEQFTEEVGLPSIGQRLGMKMKEKHTVVPAWPMRLSKKATLEEFSRLECSAHSGSERYVEWRRS